MASISSIVPNLYSRIMSVFPNKITAAFAYGSAVFTQKGNDNLKNNMIDLVFVVDDSLSWHTTNLKMNPSHYSSLKLGGSKLINYVQENLGASIYYNTLIPIDDYTIKYGVIRTDKFSADLLDWETLYTAGRLHKPVSWIIPPSSKDLRHAIKANYHSALHTALLNLPEEFNEKSLFLTIASLSYSGDFRMIFGEDKNKIINIVTPQLDEFRDLYSKSLEQIQFLQWKKNKRSFLQDCGINARLYHLNLLPKSIQQSIVKTLNKDGRHRDLEDIMQAVAADYECGDIVFQAVKDIVKKSSSTQSAKGILTAGVWKSLKYSSKKLRKMTKSLRKP